jgi:hypothetical protein
LEIAVQLRHLTASVVLLAATADAVAGRRGSKADAAGRSIA